MIQVLESNERPSFLQSLLGGVAEGLPGAIQQFQQMQMGRQQNQAIQNLLGGDVANLSPDLQKLAVHEFFKNQFTPEKSLTPLQEAQKNLAEARLGALQGQQQRFSQIFGNEKPSEFQSEPNETPQGQVNFENLSENQLRQVAAFAGQPGEEGIYGNIAQSELNKRNEEKKISREEKVQERKEQIAFHKESEKYDEELLKNSKSSQKQLDAISTSIKAIQSGNVRPSSLASVFKGFGQIGTKIANALQNKDEAALLASIPEFLEGRKELFGVRLSDADLRLLQDKLPDIGKSKEANLQILNLMKKQAELSRLKYRIGSEFKKENKGLRKLGYAEMVEERFDEMRSPVLIRNPKTGNVIEIPAFQVSQAIENGGQLVNE